MTSPFLSSTPPEKEAETTFLDGFWCETGLLFPKEKRLSD